MVSGWSLVSLFTVATRCELLTGIKLMSGAEAEAPGKYTNNKDARKRKDGIDEVSSDSKSMSSWKMGDFKLMGGNEGMISKCGFTM